MDRKNIVHGLWLGTKTLSPLELLTLKSFTAHGAEFHLWHYEPVNAPSGVVLRDGKEMLPVSQIFRYPKEMLLGFGGESHVGFSEIFRYKVLYELGGWWSDMDVTCLKPLDLFTDDYFFRNHGVLSVVGNIMKCPPKSELMSLCLDRALVEVNTRQDDWHHAIRILCYYIEFLGLSKYIRKGICNLDRYDKVHPFIKEDGRLDSVPKEWHFIHWMNSIINKDKYRINSVYGRLLALYNCIEAKMLL